MTKVLVTGASGFIGRRLVARLRAGTAMHEVAVAGREHGDIADRSMWSAQPDADVVVHLAGKTFVPESWADPSGFLASNVQGTVGALTYCMERKARLIFVSSYLYGVPAALPIAETATIQATNPYALSKQMAEEACRFYSVLFEVDVTVLRVFNIYGSGQDTRFLIPSIIEQVIEGVTVKVKDLEPKRDYVYVDDVIDALLCAIERPQRFAAINVASGTSHSVAEVIRIIQRIAGTDLPVQSAEVRRDPEVMDTRADVTQARLLLDWRPRWSLEEGCAAMLHDMSRRAPSA